MGHLLKLVAVILLIIPSVLYAQEIRSVEVTVNNLLLRDHGPLLLLPNERVKVDSTSMTLHAVDDVGDEACNHQWVIGSRYRKGGNRFCGVLHVGERCDWDNDIEPRICRLCLRKELWEERYYYSLATRPMSPYDSLEQQLKTLRAR